MSAFDELIAKYQVLYDVYRDWKYEPDTSPIDINEINHLKAMIHERGETLLQHKLNDIDELIDLKNGIVRAPSLDLGELLTKYEILTQTNIYFGIKFAVNSIKKEELDVLRREADSELLYNIDLNGLAKLIN